MQEKLEADNKKKVIANRSSYVTSANNVPRIVRPQQGNPEPWKTESAQIGTQKKHVDARNAVNFAKTATGNGTAATRTPNQDKDATETAVDQKQ